EVRVARLDLHGAVEVLERLLGPPRVKIETAEVVERAPVVLVELDDALVLLDREQEVAEPLGAERIVVARRGVLRVELDRLFVGLLRLGQQVEADEGAAERLPGVDGARIFEYVI